MTEIHQWRKKISRASTPLSHYDDRHSETGSVGESHTPKRRSRPKITSYLSYLSGANVSRPESIYKSEAAHVEFFAHVKPREDTRAVNIDAMIGSLHSILMQNPLQSLSVQHNSRLFHLFEAYRNLAEEKENLQTKLTEEREHRLAILSEHREAEKRWQAEEADYKAEIRRLELLVAQGEKGIAGVFRARQDSVLKKWQSHREKPYADHRKTVYGPVRHSKSSHDSASEKQTARLQVRPVSPSHQMAAFSRRLSRTTGSRRNVPVGTAPLADHAHSLADVSFLNESSEIADRGNLSSRTRSNTARSEKVLSQGGSSTFSCMGDPLPDEVGEDSDTLTESKSKEFQALRDMANIVARQRGISMDDVLPSLVGLFTGTSSTQSLPDSSPERPVSQRYNHQPQTTLRERREPLPDLSETNLLALANDFENHQRLNLPVNPSSPNADRARTPDTSRQGPRSYIRRGRRPFSFEPGDDNMGVRLYPTQDRSPMGASDLQHKSASISREGTPRPTLKQYHSSSSTPSLITSPMDGRRLSKIPSPSQEHPLAQPRREASTSSVSTAILHPRRESNTPVSESGSLRGGGPTVRRESYQASKTASNRSSTSSINPTGQRHPDPKGSMRNSTAALAAVRAVEGGNRRSSLGVTETVRKQPGLRSSEGGT